MLPEILGCYQSHKRQKMSKTEEAFTQVIDWLVFRGDPTRFLLFPLGQNRLPLPLIKSVTPEEFLAHFLPAPHLFSDRLEPAARKLVQRLRTSQTTLDPEKLPEAEQSLLTVILIVLSSSGVAAPGKAVLPLLTGARVATAGAEAQKFAINAFGIHLRKQKAFDKAAQYYRKALELAPDEEHLMFNLARTLFEKGEVDACRDMLEQALSVAPDFAEARKFLRYLDRHDADAMDNILPA